MSSRRRQCVQRGQRVECSTRPRVRLAAGGADSVALRTPDMGRQWDELPPGWSVEIRVRQTGRSAGTRDSYYVAPDGRTYRCVACVAPYSSPPTRPIPAHLLERTTATYLPTTHHVRASVCSPYVKGVAHVVQVSLRRVSPDGGSGCRLL